MIRRSLSFVVALLIPAIVLATVNSLISGGGSFIAVGAGALVSGAPLTFDYYVSPTGSDSNAGTLASPWAITSLSLLTANTHNVANCTATSGKRIGFLPGTYYLTTAFTGSITSGSNQMTVSGITGALTAGMALVSGLGSAYSIGSYGWGPTISSIAGSTLTLSSNAAATLTSATIIATFMKRDPVVGALQVIGSSGAPTYWGSSDSGGHYSPRTATLDAEGGSGVPGGLTTTDVNSEVGPIIAHTGEYPTSYTTSNVTIDGLRLINYSYWGIRIGGFSEGDGPSGISGVTIKNNEITGGNASVSGFRDNIQAIWIDSTTGTLITNNWIHDNAGWSSGSMDHLVAIIVFGSDTNTPSYPNQNITIQYNTLVNTGGIYGKDHYVESSTVQYNYIDVTALTSAFIIYDFSGGDSSPQTGTTIFRNNIGVMAYGSSAVGAFGGFTYGSNGYGYDTPTQVYSNTIVVNSGGYPMTQLFGLTNALAAVAYYNNIYVNNSSSGGTAGEGAFVTNPGAMSVLDYNLIYSPSIAFNWVLYQSNLTTAIGTYTTQAAFASALASNGGISNAESHSIIGSAPTFVGSGSYAAYYKLQTGSQGKAAGVSGVDMGAWGGASPPAQIGCNFAT
jgi:hypothetical protein